MTISPNDKKRYNSTVKNLQDNKDRAKKMVLRQFRYIKFIDQNKREIAYLKNSLILSITYKVKTKYYGK